MRTPRNIQPPYNTDSFKEYLSEPTLNLAICWKLVPESGDPIAATSHTQDLTLPGHGSLLFKSTQGVVPSALDTESGLTSAGLEVDSIFVLDVIEESDISAGDWDGAIFEVFMINYDTPDMGEYVMFSGYLGEISTYGVRFKAEGRPLSAKADQSISKKYVPKCVARNLGDSDCKVNLSIPAAGDSGDITLTGTVTSGGTNTEFIDTSRSEADGYFAFGIITFDTGNNSGRTVEVKSSTQSTGEIKLSRAVPYAIATGDEYTIIRGCDRLDTTCITVFDNIENFRGFSKVPGIEKANRHKPTIQG